MSATPEGGTLHRPRPHRRRPVAIATATVVVALAAISACGGGGAVSTRQSAVSTHGTRATTAPAAPLATTASSTTTPSTAGPTIVTPATTASPTTGRATAGPATNGLTIGQASTGVWTVGIDTKMLRFNLMPGSVEPRGSFIRPSSITAAFRPTVIAAFNGGFKFKDSQGGFYLGGVTPVPLVDGAASLVIFTDGTASVGQWNRDFRMSANVEAVLQNLRLMVDHGARTNVSDTDTHAWGSTFPKETTALVPRSGICVTADGRMRWFGGPGIGAATLADTMIRAGCMRGMELDINPKWVSFAVYDHPDPANPTVIRDHNLYDGMRFPPDTYFAGKQRNWVMLTQR